MGETIQDRIERSVDEIKKILLGNGKVGLCEQVRDNSSDIDEIKTRPDKLGKWVVRVIGAAIAIGELFIAYLIYKGS